jgi:tRNA nucleotidyltransferase/poly(A) polymerase
VKRPVGGAVDECIYSQAAVALCEFISASGASKIFRFASHHSARSFVCAGAVRDCLHSALTGKAAQPRDIDIGIQGLSNKAFACLGRMLRATKNVYGGYTARTAAGVDIDLWRLEDTIGTKEHCRPSTVENVLRSFILDVNAVAFEPATGRFCDLGALQALRRKRIDFVSCALLHSESKFAARAAVLASRLSFHLSGDVSLFVTNRLKEDAVRYELSKSYSAGIVSSQQVAAILRQFASRDRKTLRNDAPPLAVG